jgi:hypothetical protein
MFQWAPQHEAAIRHIFDQKGRNAVKQALYHLRNKGAGSAWKFMGEANLKKMEEKWASPGWKKKSEAGKDARLSSEGKGKAVYAGGSVSCDLHRHRLVSIVMSRFLCS